MNMPGTRGFSRKKSMICGLALLAISFQIHAVHASERSPIVRNLFDRKIDDQYNVYWGDLHNHSALTYGHGSFGNALENAAQQLDFFTVTPHGLWPDIDDLRGNEELEWVIGYHTSAFEKLRRPEYWQSYLNGLHEYNRPQEILAFSSYEVHSLKYGDHVVLSKDIDIELPPASTTITELRDQVLDAEKTIITPHGIGYQAGYRGYDWRFFKESPQTPFVEIFSRHGGSEGSIGPFGMYHDMGPRSFEGTAEAGLRAGHKFGIIASSDSHAGHPGSYGGGRIGVLAERLTRDAIWGALRARRVYASTGPNFKIDFRVNGAVMGEEIVDEESGNRKIHVRIEGDGQMDYVELIKNGHTLHRAHTDYGVQASDDEILRAKIRVEFGWNQVASKDRVHWVGALSLSGGQLLGVTTQFRGAPFTSPQKDLEGNEVPWESYVNRLTEVTRTGVSFDLFTESNPAPTHPITQSIVLDVEMNRNDRLTLKTNGQTISHSFAELLEGSRGHFMRGWLTEAVSIHRAVPEQGFALEFDLTDTGTNSEDYYFLRARQLDDQWAWSSPIWVGKGN